MVLGLHLILLLVAVIFFGIAAFLRLFAPDPMKIDLISIGLFFFALSFMFP